MRRRVWAGAAAGLLGAAAAGCGRGETKPSIPTELIQPPGPDREGGPPGKKPRDTDAKQSKQESGSDK